MKQLKTVGLMALGFLLVGCDAKSIKDPPLTITFRQGVLSKCVMQVSNLATDEGIEVYVYVANTENSVRSGNTVIPANGTKEFGALELTWELKPGDQGFVRPVKYGKKLFFHLMPDNQYKTWFGYEDIPEVDVAAQVRAKKDAEHAAWLQKTMSEMKADGMKVYVAITNANAERVASGLGSVWPKPQGSLTERAKDKIKGLKTKIAVKLGRVEDNALSGNDIAEKKFKTSGDYLDFLLDVGKIGSDKHSPYVKELPLSMVSDSDAKDGRIPTEAVRWSILADYTDDMAGCIPVIVSANFPCEKLHSFWDGKQNATESIKLSTVGAAKDEAFVAVYKDGSVKAFTADKLNLAKIYSAPFNTCTNGYNRAIQYLTPAGVVNAIGVVK